MAAAFDDIQKVAKENLETSIQSLGVVSKSLQAIATETTDYSKKSVEEASKLVETLLGAKTLENVVEIQTAYFKKSYEDAVAQTTKVTDLYVAAARDFYKPFEAVASKFGK